MPRTLTVSIDDRARSAFFFRYVSGFTSTYDILVPLYTRSSLDGPLRVSVDAVSLAFLPFHFDCPQAPELASQKYLEALPLLNKALSVPATAVSDSTLLSVLLLDLFEKISNNKPRSTGSWMSHVNGALALVNLRDKTQFQNYTGFRLLVRLTTNLLISCVAANAPVPPALTSLREEMEVFLDKDDPKWRLSGFVIRYSNLRAALQDGRITSQDVIAQLAELDEEITLLVSRVPQGWLYEKVELNGPSKRVFEHHCDVYPDHFVTQTWNVLRVLRIFLLDIIQTYGVDQAMTPLAWGDHRPHPESLGELIDSLAKEICATAPQYTTFADIGSTSDDEPAIQRLRCYTLIFPLYVAGMYASPRTNMRAWIVKEMRLMASSAGIRNANIVADILDRADGTSPWSVYAILGSYAFAA